MGQLSFYSADAHARALSDLEGVLCAPGRISLFGRGGAARLAISVGSPPADPEVPDPLATWRARALRCAFRARGVDAGITHTPDGRPVVGSAFRADLVPLATAWSDGGSKVLPPDLELDGPRLRLWVLAAGRLDGRAYVLGLDPQAPDTHEDLLRASRRAGLGADPGDDAAAPTLRVTGVRRIRRLAELVGARPPSAHDEVWPG